MATAELLSISDAARITGLSRDTLRYYERAGLMLDPIGRAPSHHRRYTEADVRWVVLLTKLRATGMPIRSLQRYAELAREGDGTEEARLALLEEHRETVLERLERIRADLQAVDAKIEIYRERIGA